MVLILYIVEILIVFLSSVVHYKGEPLTCYSCSSDSLEICATLNFGNNSRELPVEICSDGITFCFTRVSSKITSNDENVVSLTIHIDIRLPFVAILLLVFLDYFFIARRESEKKIIH